MFNGQRTTFTSDPVSDISGTGRKYTSNRDYLNTDFRLRKDVPSFKDWLSQQPTLASQTSTVYATDSQINRQKLKSLVDGMTAAYDDRFGTGATSRSSAGQQTSLPVSSGWLSQPSDISAAA